MTAGEPFTDPVLDPRPQARGTLELAEEAWAQLVPHVIGRTVAEPVPEVDIVLRGVAVGAIDAWWRHGHGDAYVVDLARVREVEITPTEPTS